MIPVSKRLQAIVDWIRGSVLADIGCDHGYVAASAILQNKVDQAFACDIAEGPLQNAMKTIEAYGLEDRMFCRLMNGMQGLDDSVDVVVIAGMGAKTIEEILDHGCLENRRFLLMPHKDAESLRQYLTTHFLFIVQERMIFDEGHYYPLMDVRHDSLNKQELINAEFLYGKNMIHDETFEQFIDQEYVKWTRIDQQMPADKRENSKQRLEILNSFR